MSMNSFQEVKERVSRLIIETNPYIADKHVPKNYLDATDTISMDELIRKDKESEKQHIFSEYDINDNNDNNDNVMETVRNLYLELRMIRPRRLKKEDITQYDNALNMVKKFSDVEEGVQAFKGFNTGNKFLEGSFREYTKTPVREIPNLHNAVLRFLTDKWFTNENTHYFSVYLQFHKIYSRKMYIQVESISNDLVPNTVAYLSDGNIDLKVRTRGGFFGDLEFFNKKIPELETEVRTLTQEITVLRDNLSALDSEYDPFSTDLAIVVPRMKLRDYKDKLNSKLRILSWLMGKLNFYLELLDKPAEWKMKQESIRKEFYAEKEYVFNTIEKEFGIEVIYKNE